MVELRILGNYGYYEILARLQKAQDVGCSQKFTKISFVRVTFDQSLLNEIQELFLTSSNQQGRPKKWDRVYFHRCQGLVNQVIRIVANANVDQFYLVGDITQNYPTTDGPFHILSNTNLCQVWFENIVFTKYMGSRLAQSMAGPSTLDSFSLCHATVEADAVGELASAFVSNRHRWKTIRLSNCDLNDDHASCLLLALFHCTNLSRIFVDGNHCHQKSLAAISMLLKREPCSLETMDISNQDHGLPKESLSELIGILQTNKTIKTLKLQNNNLNDSDLEEISTMLVQNSTLLEFDLRFNPISSKALQQIVVPNMARYKGLQRLEIRSGVGVLCQDLLHAFQETIENNWSLTKLDIFEWDRRLEHFLDLNRSNRRIFQQDGFPLSLWPLLLDRAVRKTETYIPSHLRGRKLAHSLASRKASILFYFLRNSPTIFADQNSDPSMVD